MKIFLALIFALIISTPLFTQTEIDAAFFNPATDYYSNNYLDGLNSGKGNTGIASDNDISGVLLNPATLNIKNRIQLSVQYAYKTSHSVKYTYTEFDPSFKFTHLPPAISVRFGYRINKHLQMGALYSNTNGLKAYYGNINMPTGNQYVYVNVRTHVLAVPVVFNYNDLSIALNGTYTNYRVYNNSATTPQQPETETEISNWVWRFNAQLGVKYKILKTLSFGASFTPGFKSELSGSETSISPNVKFVARYPAKIGAGIEYTLSKNAKVLFDYNFQKLSELNEYKDRHDINLGLEYILNKNWGIRGGFFTLRDTRNLGDTNVVFIDKEKYDQYFLTFGASYSTPRITGFISVMDSHISPGIIKLFYVNTGVTLNF